MESTATSAVAVGPPRRVWKEVYNQGRKETDPLSYFMRIGESGKDLREQQPHLTVIWNEREIPEGDKVIWLDPSKNELEEAQNAEYDRNMELFLAEIADLNRRESPLLKTLQKLLLPKISHLGPEVFMRWSEKDASEKYILARNNRINGLLLARMTDSGMVPVLSTVREDYYFKFKPNNKTPSLIYSIEQNPEKNPLRKEHLELVTSFLNQLRYFIYSYTSIDGIAHSIILKRRNLETMELIDPNSESWDANKAIMDPISRNNIEELLRIMNVKHVELIPCVRQSRGNCFLWALFFALNINKLVPDALKMIDDVLTKVGLPVTDETRDNVLLELMYGFLERPVLASSVNEAEFTVGLGKSKYKKMVKYKLPKLRGGFNARDFYDQSARLSKGGMDESEDTFEKFRNIIINNPRESWGNFDLLKTKDLKFKFQVIENAMKTGTYGDENDRALVIQNSSGQQVNVYDRVRQLIGIINSKRPSFLFKKLGKKAFYAIPEWREFYELYGVILSRAFDELREEARQEAVVQPPRRRPPPPRQPGRRGPPPPSAGRWIEFTQGTDVWYRNFDDRTAQGVWTLPEGGVIVERRTLEPEPAPAPAPAPAPVPAPIQEGQPDPELETQIDALPARMRQQIRNFQDVFQRISIGRVMDEEQVLDDGRTLRPGDVWIQPQYIEQVNHVIRTLLGERMLTQLTNESSAYLELINFFNPERANFTFERLSRGISARFPIKWRQLRLSGLDPTRKLIRFVEMYEAEIIRDFIRLSEEPSGRGKRIKGKAMPENLNVLQQIAKQSYNLVDPQKEINGWVLKKWNSTMKFYVKGNEVIVGVRGTKTNAPDGNYDLTADSTIPFNGIPGTTRYKRDKAAVQQFQRDYPPDEYSYYAVGHSLGGAIIDSLIKDGFIKEATSYNPAIQYSDINAGLPNRRIYYGSDPLYRLMGWWDRKSEHREPENRTWADWLGSVSLPAAAIAALPAHKLENFQGGKRNKK